MQSCWICGTTCVAELQLVESEGIEMVLCNECRKDEDDEKESNETNVAV